MTTQQALNTLISVRRYLLWIPCDIPAQRLTADLVGEFINDRNNTDFDIFEAHDYSDKWEGVAHLIDLAKQQQRSSLLAL